MLQYYSTNVALTGHTLLLEEVEGHVLEVDEGVEVELALLHHVEDTANVNLLGHLNQGLHHI